MRITHVHQWVFSTGSTRLFYLTTSAWARRKIVIVPTFVVALSYRGIPLRADEPILFLIIEELVEFLFLSLFWNIVLHSSFFNSTPVGKGIIEGIARVYLVARMRP